VHPTGDRLRASVLVVDDDPDMRGSLAISLGRHGYAVETAGDRSETLRALERQDFDVIFADERVAGMADLAMLRQAHPRGPWSTVVLMTAHGAVADAVRAIRAGAYDYLVKPLALDQVQRLLDRIVGVKAASRQDSSAGEVADAFGILESTIPSMRRAVATARRAAAFDAVILLTGESGTGKKVLASAIHAWSARRTGPFVTIPCSAHPDHLHGRELRGRVLGAGRNTPSPIDAARGGTLFLDEVGDLAPEAQGRLLHLLTGEGSQEISDPDPHGLDVRVIAATHRNLEAEVSAGRFRDDLFFRLNVVTIALPPLRERHGDLASLTDHSLARLAARYGRGAIQVSIDARRLLAGYHWPGNHRELVNVLERALILSPGDTITPEHLPDRLLAGPSHPSASTPASTLSLEELEQRHIEQVLAESETLEEAATRLGINPTTLWRKRKRYRLAATVTAGPQQSTWPGPAHDAGSETGDGATLTPPGRTS
jgi:two-component system, NtrC family, response regulator AlgB